MGSKTDDETRAGVRYYFGVFPDGQDLRHVLYIGSYIGLYRMAYRPIYVYMGLYVGLYVTQYPPISLHICCV